MGHHQVVLRADSAAATADEAVARHESDGLEWASALGSGGGYEEEVLRDVLVALVCALVCRGGHRVSRACDGDGLLQATPHTQKTEGVRDLGDDVHALCEGCVVIAAQDGSHRMVTAGATRRVEVEVGEIHAYDRGEEGCHQCHC